MKFEISGERCGRIMGVAVFLGILFLLASSMVAEETNAGTGKPLYHFSFDEKTPANTGSIGGEAVEDSELRNLRFAPAEFVPDTPSGTGSALDMSADLKHPQQGSVLVLPESEQRLGLSKPGQAMTVAMWVKLHPEDPARDGRTLIAKGQWAKEGWWLGLNKANQLVFQYRPAHKPKSIWGRRTEKGLPVNKWVHLMTVIRTQAPNGRGIEMFIDGEPAPLNQGIPGVPIMPSEGPIVIGGMNTSNGWPLNGMVDDLRVYDKEVPLMDLMREVPGLSMGDFSVQEYITSTAEGRVKLELQRLVDTAVARGQKEIKLPEGRFYLEKGLVIAGIDGFSLKGAGKGKTILVRADGVVVSVSESENITFEDFSVDVEPLPFTQGTITSVKKEPSGGHIMDFELHEGYPRLTEEALQQVHGTAWFMDKDTRRLKEGRGWFGPKPGRNVLRVDDSHGQLKLWNAVDIGDYIVLKIHGAVPFVLRDSESVRLEDIEILASSSLGVAARFLTGENYFRYTIKPGPTPPGATQARLVSSNADGIQYFWCPGAVTFEDCDFGYMGDDGVNISIPTALQVVEVQSPTRVLASTRTAEPEMKRMIEMSAPGDIIRLLRYGTFEPLGDLPLQAMSWDGRREGVQWLADEHGTSQGKGEMSFVTVEFQRTPKVPIKVGDRLSPRKFLPKRFAIRNSRFHDTRARGLLIMASNGIIEGNTIEYTYLSGIELCHEIPGFGGLGWVSDVAVRNNTLRDVCIMGGPGFVNWAAIALCNTSISPRKEPPGAYPWAIGHRNVDITGNTIDRCYGAGILVNGLDGGTVASNTIRRSNQREEHSAQKKEGVTAVHPITIMNSKGITISGNKIIEPGAYAHEPYVNDIGMYPPKQ